MSIFFSWIARLTLSKVICPSCFEKSPNFIQVETSREKDENFLEIYNNKVSLVN